MNISPTVSRISQVHAHSARGSVAVELALLLAGLIIILTPVFSVGFYFVQYNAMKNVGLGAASYLAASGEWASLASARNRRNKVEEVALQLATESGLPDVDPQASCPPGNCGSVALGTVEVTMELQFSDPFNFWPASLKAIPVTSTFANPN